MSHHEQLLSTSSVRHLTLGSATLLIASAGIGSGFLALPQAADAVGLRTALLCLLAGAVLTALSTAMLLVACVRLEAYSYGEVITKSIGAPLPEIGGISCVDWCVSVYLVLSQVAFVTFIADFVELSLQALFGANVNRVALLCVVTLSPSVLCMHGTMASVERLAGLSTLAIIFTGAMVFAQACVDRSTEEHNGTPGRNQTFAAFVKITSLILFSFAVAFNVPKVAEELRDTSAWNCCQCAVLSTAVLVTFYVVIMSSVAYSFAGNRIPVCFLDAYEAGNTAIALCRCALILTLGAGASTNMVAAVAPLRKVVAKKYQLAPLCAATLGCMTLVLFQFPVGFLLEVMGVLFGVPEAVIAPAVVLAYQPQVLFTKGSIPLAEAPRV